jgi:hypothetical protein
VILAEPRPLRFSHECAEHALLGSNRIEPADRRFPQSGMEVKPGIHQVAYRNRARGREDKGMIDRE